MLQPGNQAPGSSVAVLDGFPGTSVGHQELGSNSGEMYSKVETENKEMGLANLVCRRFEQRLGVR